MIDVKRLTGNNFNYFPENKLTKLANFVQFIRMLMFYLEDWGLRPPAFPTLGHATGLYRSHNIENCAKIHFH